MGQRWLRGPLANNAGVADPTNDYVLTCRDFNLFVFYYLRRILGFTYVEEVQQSGSSWVWDTAHEHTAADGVLTATDYTFSSASALFAAGDVGKFLVMVDATNEENCGIYEIDTFTSSSIVTVKWYTTGGNFPTASTGITWYLIDGETAGDPRNDDYYVLEVPHATSPYTMKCRYLGFGGGSFNGSGTGIEVAPEASAWNVGTHTWNTGVRDRLFERKVTRGFVNSAHGRTFAYGHTDGSHWMVWDHHINATGVKEGAGVTILGALESSPAPDAEELVYAWGQGLSSNNSASWGRSIVDTVQEMSWGSVWSERGGLAEDVYWLSWYDSADIFRANVGVNARTSKRDALPIWTMRDPLNAGDNWAPWGEIPTAHMVVATVNILGEHVSFDSDNFLHIRDDLVIPWPGLPFA